jgi:hypothetical protein
MFFDTCVAIIFVDMGINPNGSDFIKLRTFIAANNLSDEWISTTMLWTHQTKTAGEKLLPTRQDSIFDQVQWITLTFVWHSVRR